MTTTSAPRRPGGFHRHQAALIGAVDGGGQFVEITATATGRHVGAKLSREEVSGLGDLPAKPV
jgi:hypothetical protein